MLFVDEDMDCSTMSRNFERSTSSSQHSALARPITLNFSDDDELEGNVDDKYVSTAESHLNNCNRDECLTKNSVDVPDSSR